MRSRRGGFCRSERGLHHPDLLVLPRAQRAARSRRSGYQAMDLQRMRSDPWSRPQRRHQHRPSRKRDARSSLIEKPLPSGRGGFTQTAMSKLSTTAGQLQHMALSDIQAYRGCGTVTNVGIHSIADDRAECNWSISVLNLGDADGDLAHQAAIEVHDRLSSEFDLLTE